MITQHEFANVESFTYEYFLDTPSLESVSPLGSSSVEETVLTLSGQRFGDSAVAKVILRSNTSTLDCVVTSRLSTEVQCIVGVLRPAIYDVLLSVGNIGYASDAMSFPVFFDLEKVEVHPGFAGEGSNEGGGTIILTGHGLVVLGASISILVGPLGATDAERLDCSLEEASQSSTFFSTVYCFLGNNRDIQTDEFLLTGSQPVEIVTSFNGISESASCESCMFTFTSAKTAIVEGLGGDKVSFGETITAFGQGFSTSASDNIIYMGDFPCTVTSCTVTFATLQACQCALADEGAGRGRKRYLNKETTYFGYGRLIKDTANPIFTWTPEVTSVSHNSGGFGGGLILTVVGKALLKPGVVGNQQTIFKVGGDECVTLHVAADFSLLTCIVPPNDCGGLSTCSEDITGQLIGTFEGQEFEAEVEFDTSVQFEYENTKTPVIESVSPSSGSAGTLLVISGQNFNAAEADNKVTFAGIECTITSATTDEIQCELGNVPAGQNSIEVFSSGKGNAVWSSSATGQTFEALLVISSVSPLSVAPQSEATLTIIGQGFPQETSFVTATFSTSPTPLTVLSTSVTELVVKLPKFVTTSLWDIFPNLRPGVLSYQDVTSNPVDSGAELAFDGLASTFHSCAQVDGNCTLGIDMGTGLGAVIRSVFIHPLESEEDRSGGVIEGSNDDTAINEDDRQYTVLKSVRGLDIGVNEIVLSTTGPLSSEDAATSYRFLRYRTAADTLKVREIVFKGHAVQSDQATVSSSSVRLNVAVGTASEDSDVVTFDPSFAPTITNVSPAFGTALGGTLITVDGTGFDG